MVSFHHRTLPGWDIEFEFGYRGEMSLGNAFKASGL
jgi:hypothetical protein